MKMRLVVALAATWLMCLSVLGASPQYTVTVSNVDELTNLDIGTLCSLEPAVGPVTAPTAIMLGYYSPGDRGGGTFMWDPNSSANPDGGRYFVTNGWTSGSGRWVRQLNGEVANVKMWGAKGDGVTDDTIAIQHAVSALAYPWCGELLFPASTYVLTNTIVYPSQYHLRGEGPCNNTIIQMHGDHDVFRTANADAVLNGVVQTDYIDHGLLFENMNIQMDTNAVAGAGLMVSVPGEAATIRNLIITGGGYGIRVLGGGPPGLHIDHVSVSDMYVAGISVEGYSPSGSWLGPASAMNIVGLSGDHHRPDSDATASLLRIDKDFVQCSVYDFKAEGSWGGGLFYYDKSIGTTNRNDWNLGELRIFGGSYNCGFTNCDFVVLDSEDHARTASVIIDPVTIFGIGHLIRDNVTPRNIDPGLYGPADSLGLNQTMCRLPIHYEAGEGASRCIIGGADVASFVPPATNKWYRIVQDGGGFSFGERLTITDPNHSSEAEVDIDPSAGSTGPLITVTRPTKSFWIRPPFATEMRAGSYYDPDPSVNGNRYFVDIYVNYDPYTGDPQSDRIMVRCPFEGPTGNGDFTFLTAPTGAYTDDPTPPGCTLLSCVTNSLIR